jgi:sec-independent protein translocase protein TatB
MFDIGWGELVVIGIVALIVIGPKELPTVLRTVGQWMSKVRRMASEFQGQFQEAMREAEFADLKKQVDAIGDTTRDFTKFDPLETARKEIEGAAEDKPAATARPALDAGTAPPLAAADAPPLPPATAAEPSISSPKPIPPPTESDFNLDQPSPPVPQGEGGRAA